MTIRVSPGRWRAWAAAARVVLWQLGPSCLKAAAVPYTEIGSFSLWIPSRWALLH